MYDTVIVCGDLKLLDAADDAAKKWTFKPFTKDGHPTRAIARLMFQMKPPSPTKDKP